MRTKIDKETLKNIKDDLRLYFDFLELYNKPRRSVLRSKIDEFVKNEASIMRRIRFIEELDREEKKSEASGKKKEETLTSQSPSKNKNKKLKKKSLLSFIFGDRKAVKGFGDRTKTMVIKLLGFIRTSSPESVVEWARYRTDIQVLLYKVFAYIISNGWKYLNRLQYNVCVSFANFISDFVKNSIPYRKGKADEQITYLDPCLSHFLQVVSSEEYRRILLESVKLTLPHISSLLNTKHIMPFLEDITDPDPTKTTSFINIILSMYMLYYNKHINFNNLVALFKLPKINANKYNLHKDIKKAVFEEVKKARQVYNSANKDLFYIKLIDNSLTLHSDKSNNFVRMFNRICVTDRDIQTIDKVDNPAASNPFRFIEEDLSGVIMRFISGFIMTYGDVLNGTIYIKTVDNQRKKIRIFDPKIFSKAMEELKEIFINFQLMKQASEFTTISLKTYKNHLDNIRATSDKEEKLCLYTKEAFEIFYRIRNKLNEVMYNNFIANSLSGESLLKAQKHMPEPIDSIEENKPRFLPYGTDQVIINRYHEGKTVNKLVNEIISLSGNMSYLFKEHSTIAILNKEDELLRICEEALLTISKIS